MEFENTIGLETHVQLKTNTKMFCGCLLKTGCDPNTNVCPVCLGYPGALPVMNKEAVKLTVMSGMMLGCEISRHATFDRKNYFYPDMAKDYQISENVNPLCIGGGISGEGDYLLDLIVPLVRAEVYGHGIVKDTDIRIATLRNDAGIIGGAVLGLK